MELAPLFLFVAAALLMIFQGRRIADLLREIGEPDTSIDEDRHLAHLAELVARKDTLLRLIRSTELDFEMTKISAADRDKTIARIKPELVLILQEIDAHGGLEQDRATADELLKSRLEHLKSSSEADAWSPAALARHGGKLAETTESP